jgi:putative nucleotidyltransferase with HDIG domain
VELAALSVLRAGDAVITVCSRRVLDRDAEQFLVENLERLHARSGAAFPMPEAHRLAPVREPDPESDPIERAEIAAIQSSLLASAPDELTILSLVFRQGAAAGDRDGFKSVHALLKSSLAEIREATRYREAFRGLVNKLLEPGLRKITALRNHSLNVGRTARRFAAHLTLPAADVEQITVAAILHDVGMRDLNYDELYQKRSLTDEERNLLREHPRVGAFLLSEIPWPYDIVPLVRHHHERWDGEGYPDGIRGEQIPLGARVIHLCEAFDAMTSPTSYRAVISVHQALDILESKGGTQFDPELAPAFKRMVEGWKS